MPPKKIDETMFRSASRILAILMSFRHDNSPKGINEISKEVGLSLSTASRLVHLLEGQGFLHSDPWNNKFSLGRAVFDLGQAITESLRNNLVTIAKPDIDALRDALGLNVALEVLLGNSTVLAYTAYGRQRHSFGPVIGQRMPVHVAAGAKAILAFSSPEFVDEVLRGELVQLTPRTITDAQVLKKQLAQFKCQGVAFDYGEGTLDLHVIAAPVFNYEEKPVAAVATGDLAHKIKGHFDDRVISLVKETARKISALLFHNGTRQDGD